MANIIDYLKWRGDLPFSKSKPNDIDIIIFSQLVLLDLKGCVPYKTTKDLYSCAEKYFSLKKHKKTLGYIIPDEVNELFSLMAKSERFKNLELSHYKEDIDAEVETQFSAITIDAKDISTKFVVFSGTDDTLVGWKENFNLIYKTPTESQIQSVKYLNTVAKNYSGKIVVLGHSKGGNLAIYSSSNCEESVRIKIKKIFNLDGPGIFEVDEAENIYRNIQKKVVAILPQSSVIGRLFEHDCTRIIVDSKEKGLLQHDCFSWQVRGTELITENEFSNESSSVDSSLRNILASLPKENREIFVETVFSLFYSTGATTLTQLTKKGKNLVKLYFKLDKDKRSVLNSVLGKILADKSLRKCFAETSKGIKRNNAKKENK